MQSQISEKGDSLNEAFFSLISYARHIDGSAQKWFKKKGDKNSMNQWGVMHFLHKNKGASQLEIAEYINRDAATVTRLLDRMSDNGLVERAQNLDDKRKWKVLLTIKGESNYNEMREEAATLISASFIGIHMEEIQQLLNTIEKISKNIKI